jgi:hypothetical protein
MQRMIYERWKLRGRRKSENNGEVWASVIKDIKDFKARKIVLGILCL